MYHRQLSSAVRISSLVFLTIAMSTQSVFAGTHWIKLTSPHFEMYTTNSVGPGMRAMATFERARSFFLEMTPTKKAPDRPVRIVAFRSESEFKSYRPGSGTFAYYLQSPKQDYIVMQDLATETNRIAIHEYTHLIAEHSGMKLPIWLNEGVAEVFSSLEAKGDKAIVGRQFDGHRAVLAQEHWLNLEILTSVDRSSYYANKVPMHVFYAQSWLLTHMLFLDEKYRDKFGDFLDSISSGSSSAQALSSVYSKTLDQVRLDLEAHFRRRTAPTSVYKVKLGKKSLEPDVADLSPLASDLALADLLASSRVNVALAKKQLDNLAAKNPQNSEIEESLGYLAWQSEDTKSAERHFAKAMELGSNEPEFLYRYAMLIGPQEDKLEVSISALQKVLAVKPEHHEALLLLAVQNMRAHHYRTAVSNFAALKKVSPDEAFTAYSGLANCYVQLKSCKAAREMAIRAKPFAKTEEDRRRIDELIRDADTLAMTKESGTEPPGIGTPHARQEAQQ